MIPESILLLMFNFVFASFVIAAIVLVVSFFGRSLPIRHLILLVGLVACLTAPLAITVGWIGNWGRLPSYELSLADRLINSNSTPHSLVNVNRGLPPVADSELGLASTLDGSESIGLNTRLHSTPNSNNSLEGPILRKSEISSGQFLMRGVGSVGVLVWSLGIIFSVGLLLRRWCWVKHLVSGCEVVNDLRVHELALTRARRLGLTQIPKMLKSSSLSFPAVTGFRRPHLIIPERLLRLEYESELQMILAHELAHISRKDHRTILLQAVAACVYWWNPLVHRVSSQLSNFRELICDDIVVACCGRWEDYARAIVEIAEEATTIPQNNLQLGMSAGDLEQRVVRLLSMKGEGMSTRTSVWTKLTLVCIATIGVCSLAVAQVPVHLTAHESQPIEIRLGEPGIVDDKESLTSIDREVVKELSGVKETPSIVFHFRPEDFDENELAKVIELNLAKFEECEKLLRMNYQGRIHIFLYRSIADLQKMTNTAAVAFSTGTCSIHQAVDFDSVHELTHIFALQFPSGEDAVTDDFVVEGLATILAELDEGIPIHNWAAVYQSTSRLPDLIEFRRTWPDGLLPGVHPYHVAGSFVGYLIEEFGIEKVKRWYVQSTEAHMEFGKPLRRLERDWHAWLERRSVHPKHRDHIQTKLGLIPEKIVLAKESSLFDGKSLSGLQSDEVPNWQVNNGRLVGSTQEGWTYIYSKNKFQPSVGVRAKFRLVKGKAVTLQLNRETGNGNHVNLATWATYMSLTNGAYVVIENLKLEHGKWNEVVVVNENGIGRLYLNGLIIHEHEGAFSLREGSIGIGVESGTIEIEELVGFDLASPN